jgi:anti-sigma B factor antagonist
MFEIKIGEENTVQIIGRFDASQTDKAKDVFKEITKTTLVDFEKLIYISSAGLGVLLMTQKRLKKNDYELILTHLNNHIKEVFRYAGFDMIFRIE